MPKVLPRHRQSNYDLVLQTYGSVDRLLKLCKDNNVTDLNQVLPSLYSTDNNFIVNKNIIGYKYATQYLGRIICNKVNYVSQNNEPYVSQTNKNYVTQCEFNVETDYSYDFHPYTIDFLDKVSLLLGNWQDYLSMLEAVNLDDLVRNLVGEDNGFFVTSNIWSKLKQFCPIMSNNSTIQSLNLVDLSRNLNFYGSTLTHGLNYFKTSNIGDYSDTGFLDDGTDVPRINMCFGVAISDFIINSPSNDSMITGAYGGSSIYLKINAEPDNKYKAFIYPGDITTTQEYRQEDTLHFSSAPATARLFDITGTMIGSYSVPDFFSSTGLSYTVGKMNGDINTDRICKSKYNTTYIGTSLTTQERKSLLNSVNYFLYQKGVRNSFSIIT